MLRTSRKLTMQSNNSASLHLFVFFGSELGLAVGDVNVQSGGSFNDGGPFLGADTGGDFASPGSVRHHQAVKFVQVVNEKLLETHLVSAGVSGVFVGSVTDAWVASLTTESSSEGTIDTLWSSPWRVSDSNESIDLVSGELLVSLLQERVLANSFLCHF